MLSQSQDRMCSALRPQRCSLTFCSYVAWKVGEDVDHAYVIYENHQAHSFQQTMEPDPEKFRLVPGVPRSAREDVRDNG